MDESDLKNLSDIELRALTALVRGLIEDPKLLTDYSREEFNNGLCKANWIQSRVRGFQKIIQDDDFAFYYELYAESGYRILAQKYDISAKDDTVEYWRNLCIRVINDYVPAYKVRNYKHKKTDTQKLDLIGNVERICLEEGVRPHTAAQRLSQRTDLYKRSTIKTHYSNHVKEFALKLVDLSNSEERSGNGITYEKAEKLVKKIALNYVERR